MKILVVAATENEIAPLKEKLSASPMVNVMDFLVTGVGMVNTTYALTKRFQKESYDLALNVGLAGSFDTDLPIGSVVAVSKDCFYELGAEDGDDFIPADKLGLTDNRDVAVKNAMTDHHFLSVSAITVNKVHGEDRSILSAKVRSGAAIESMEGAAFYFVCNQEGVKCLQIRAISNRVERRNREAWNVPLALDALTESVFVFLKSLES